MFSFPWKIILIFNDSICYYGFQELAQYSKNIYGPTSMCQVLHKAKEIAVNKMKITIFLELQFGNLAGIIGKEDRY